MNSIADALRKLHPEMNAKMVFTPERGQEHKAPDLAGRDVPIEFQLDPDIVARALTAQHASAGQASVSPQYSRIGDTLPRRVMRRSLQGVALLSLAGMAGVFIASGNLNFVSARVEPRTTEPEAAETQPMAPIELLTVAEAVPASAIESYSEPELAQALPDESMAPLAEIPETLVAYDNLLGDKAPMDLTETFAAPIDALYPESPSPSASPSDPFMAAADAEQTGEPQIHLQPVTKALPVVANASSPPKRTIERVTRREPLAVVTAETIWSGSVAPETIAEIPYETEEPLYEGDFPPAHSGPSDSARMVSNVKPKDAPMRLEGIFWEKERPLALINGEIVEQGGTFRGAKVLEIHRTSIVIDENGQHRVLTP